MGTSCHIFDFVLCSSHYLQLSLSQCVHCSFCLRRSECQAPHQLMSKRRQHHSISSWVSKVFSICVGPRLYSQLLCFF
ncbi:hypothetical protein Peur_050485 [Populus x canadensis]